MAKKSKSSVITLIAAAVLAALGALVFQKVKAESAAASGNPAGQLDDKAKEWVSEVVATPRQ